jgi:uroporphyrinogen-III synthase|tara:strand:- start:484 stop:1152 length:669 start_codon:yes stop_codon:yes gene_type:complete
VKKIKILSTKILGEKMKQIFDDNKFELLEHNFIKIGSLNFDLPEHDGSWIFTSQNAVNAVFSISKSRDLIFNKIYCVGESTKSILSKNGQKVAKNMKNSSKLANFISKKAKNEKFVFCRSNIKNDDFTTFFKKEKIDLKEIVVYNNQPNSVVLKDEFEAIMFYSPSGVKSFLKNNKLGSSYCICIGETTARYARNFSSNVLNCKTPSIKHVIDKTIKLFANE